MSAQLDDRTELERHLLEQLDRLQLEHERAAAPIRRQLAELRATRPPAPIFVRRDELTPELAARLGARR